uniref:DNA-directed DNA polymerase n=1 Tax=viral metagenome TaxID=1070528 RepID=A0A6M3J2I4_9ZZZZ
MGKVPLALCDSCPLKDAPLVPPRGLREFADLVLVGEAPGRDEVRRRQVFIGRSGQLLQRCLDALDLKSIWITNAALCYCEDVDDKEPASYCCRARLFEEIKRKNPKIVVTLGNIPTNAVLGGGITGITARRGKTVLSEELGAKVLPTFHPAAILRRAAMYPDFAMDLQKAAYEIQGPPPEEAAREEEMPPAKATNDFREALAAAEASGYAILDLETSGFSYSQDRILCIVIGTEQGVFVLKQGAVYDPEFAVAFQACRARWVGHGSKFDKAFMKAQLGVSVDFTLDTLLAHYAFDERGGIHDLKQVCARMFDAPDWEGDITKYLTKPKTDSYALLPKGALYRYAAFDGYYTRRLADVLIKRLKRAPAQRGLVKNLLVPASNALADVEVRGIRVDLARAETTRVAWSQELRRLEVRLAEAAGVAGDMNPRSTKQVGAYLFDALGLPEVRGRSTDKDVLAILESRYGSQIPFLGILREHRHLAKLLGTYIVGLQKRAEGDRIHTNFLLFGTVTGRLSSRNPNLQNLPSDPGDPYGSQIRDLYIASEGMSLIYLDYSQAELRMIATLSEDPFLIDVYQKGGDLHNETSIELFGPNFTPRERFFAKTVNFGLPYGRSAAAIASDVNLPGLSRAQAEEFITRYFERIPRVVQWIEETKKTVRAQGYVESRTGRRRRFPLRTDDIIAEVERQSVNFLAQSGASDTTLTSLIHMHHELAGRAHVLLTVHDSVLLECPTEHVEEVAKEGVAIMERTGEELWGSLVPFKASAEVGERWGSLRELEL